MASTRRTANGGGRLGDKSAPGWHSFAIMIVLLAFLCAAEYRFAVWVLPQTNPANISSSGKPKGKSTLFSIKGFETTRIHSDRRVKFSIGSIVLAPRKYIVFSIQPLNELLLQDLRIDYFRLPWSEAPVQLADIAKTLLPTEREGLFGDSFGVITRSLVDGFTLAIHDEDRLTTVIRAEKAEFDSSGNRIDLSDAVVEQHNFQRIVRSSHAVLKTSESAVEIHGKYMIMHPEGVLRGSGLRVRL